MDFRNTIWEPAYRQFVVDFNNFDVTDPYCSYSGNRDTAKDVMVKLEIDTVLPFATDTGYLEFYRS